MKSRILEGHNTQIVTDYIKGDITVAELQNLADDLNVKIASKEDLLPLLRNSFLLNVLADEYNIPEQQIKKKVRELMKYLNINENFKRKSMKSRILEGKKVFKVNPQIGKSKYSISSHDGKSKNKDGSDFFDIKIYKTKKELEIGIKEFTKKGYIMENNSKQKLVKIIETMVNRELGKVKPTPKRKLNEAFTRQHYVAIAKAFKENDTKEDIFRELALMFKNDNPSFKMELFYRAAGIEYNI